MVQETIPNLKKRIKAAEAKKDARRSLNQSAYEIAMPQRNMYNNQSIGDSKMQGVYTSLGMTVVNNFVNNLQSSLTPPFTRWAELKAGDDISEDMESDVNIALEQLTKKIFTFIHASNFATASTEMYYDLSVGTGALLLNKGTPEQPLNFQAIPTSQLALEEGIFGTIWGIFRKNKLSGRLIIPSWPDANIPDVLQRKINDKPEEEITLDEVTYYSPKSKKWYYEILWLEGNIAERLVTRVTIWNPWVIVRWFKMPGEVEGRGLLLQALPDLKMLNHGKEMAAVSVQMNAFGSYTMEEDGIMNTAGATIAPGGFLIVKNNPGGPHAPSIAALPRTGDTKEQEFFFQNLEANIKKVMMDNKLPEESGAVRSPTEIIQRIKEFQTDFGSAFGRLMFEYIQPLFKTVIQLLEAEEKITVPTIPMRDMLTGQIVQRKITDEIAFTKIKMLAPVAKVQALEDIQNIVQAIQITQTIEPRLPLVAYKVEELPGFFADKLGMPEKYVRTATEQAQAMQSISTLFGGQQAAA
jgi:hypothetical protein